AERDARADLLIRRDVRLRLCLVGGGRRRLVARHGGGRLGLVFAAAGTDRGDGCEDEGESRGLHGANPATLTIECAAMQRRVSGLLTLILLCSCGGKKGDSPKTKDDAASGPSVAPLAMPPSGVDKIARMNFVYGDGWPAY